MITPLLRPAGGSTILVNRGFVSTDVIKNHPELLVKEQGANELVGLLRASQTKNMFTPDNKPEAGDWYWADVDGMASFAGGLDNGVQPVYVEALYGEGSFLVIGSLLLTAFTQQDGNTGEAAYKLAHGEPIGRSSNIELRNMHRTYAVTWSVSYLSRASQYLNLNILLWIHLGSPLLL